MSKILRLSDEAVAEHISILTYTREAFRTAKLDPVTLERYCPLDNGRHHYALFKISSLGRLQCLPAGVIQNNQSSNKQRLSFLCLNSEIELHHTLSYSCSSITKVQNLSLLGSALDPVKIFY